MLTQDDRRLIQKRRRVLRHLRMATWLVPVLWLVVCVLTYLRYPLLNDPWALDRALQARELNRASLESLCTMAPLMVLLVQALVIVFIVMGLAMLRRERRLLDLLEREAGTE